MRRERSHHIDNKLHSLLCDRCHPGSSEAYPSGPELGANNSPLSWDVSKNPHRGTTAIAYCEIDMKRETLAVNSQIRNAQFSVACFGIFVIFRHDRHYPILFCCLAATLMYRLPGICRISPFISSCNSASHKNGTARRLF